MVNGSEGSLVSTTTGGGLGRAVVVDTDGGGKGDRGRVEEATEDDGTGDRGRDDATEATEDGSGERGAGTGDRGRGRGDFGGIVACTSAERGASFAAANAVAVVVRGRTGDNGC